PPPDRQWPRMSWSWQPDSSKASAITSISVKSRESYICRAIDTIRPPCQASQEGARAIERKGVPIISRKMLACVNLVAALACHHAASRASLPLHALLRAAERAATLAPLRAARVAASHAESSMVHQTVTLVKEARTAGSCSRSVDPSARRSAI